MALVSDLFIASARFVLVQWHSRHSVRELRNCSHHTTGSSPNGCGSAMATADPCPDTRTGLLWDSAENTQRHFDAAFNLRIFRSSWHLMSADTRMGSSQRVVHGVRGLSGPLTHHERLPPPAAPSHLRAGWPGPALPLTLVPSVQGRRGLL